MKKYLIIALAALLALGGCRQSSEPKVMVRAVPERMDDFVFENNLIAGRIYGKALEGNPTSPGIDIWVKKPGKLVANEWYAAAQSDPEYYHHNHDGKDCYKVAVSLGGGASAAMAGDSLVFPATNYRTCEIVEQKPDKAVFVLHYPEWNVGKGTISLDKKITVTADSYFCKSEDTYTFTGMDGDTLLVAAGIFRHPDQNSVIDEISSKDRYGIWEKASDQSVEPEDGQIGVGVFVPDAEGVKITSDQKHGLVFKKVKSGETFTYYFGSCWSKGDIQSSEKWFEMLNKLK